MGHDRNTPPSEWPHLEEAGLTRLTADIYYGWLDGAPDPTFFHWCPTTQRWLAAGTPRHDLRSREPLHLEPSLLWECCGTHGFVRGGAWIPA